MFCFFSVQESWRCERDCQRDVSSRKSNSLPMCHVGQLVDKCCGFSSCFSRFAVDVYGTAEKREKKRVRRKDNASLGMSASINTNQLAIHCLVTTESAAVPFRAPTAALKESLISCFQRCCPPPPPKPPDRHTHTNPHTNANTLSPLLLV